MATQASILLFVQSSSSRSSTSAQASSSSLVVHPPASVPIGGKHRAIELLRSQLTVLFTSNRTHEMFGAVAKGLLRAPFEDFSRKNAVSWWNIIESICNRDFARPLRIGENQCWMTKSNSYKLTVSSGGSTQLVKSFKVVRFIAFLMQPSSSNWEALKAGTEAIPFDHFCHRGEATDPQQQGYVCVNGVEHGEFSTREANESRKLCTFGARCLCPGHGPSLIKCIFTNPSGLPHGCRNVDNCVPQCRCDPRCF